METTTFLHRLFIIEILFLLSTAVLTAQVKIKEKVEIAPSKTVRDTVYNIIGKPFGKLGKTTKTTSAITVPFDSYVIISVIGSSTAASIDLVLRSPYELTIIPMAAPNGGEWQSDRMVASTLDVGIFWRLYDENGNETTGKESGVLVNQTSDSTYEMKYEDVGVDWDYNDLEIQVMICSYPKADHFDVLVSKDTIKYNEDVSVCITAKDKEDNDIEFASDASIELTATSSEFGRLYVATPGSIAPPDSLKPISPVQKNIMTTNNVVHQIIAQKNKMPVKDNSVMSFPKSVTEGEGQFFTSYWSAHHWLYYIADGTEPEENKTVTFTASCPDDPTVTAGMKSVVIVPKKKLILTAIPSTICKGDTALLVVKKKLPDGTLESYPPDQVIDIWMNTDDSYGKFRSVSTGQEGSEIVTQQPFQFIAADSIDADTVMVEAQVWVEDDYNMPTATIMITKEQGCIQTKFAATPLSVGDTTTLQFVYTETNQPVPANKLLDVSILSGDGTSGWLLPSSGSPNVALNGVVQPIRYIAPSSIQGDSLLVYIKAVVSDAGGTGGSGGGDASASFKDASVIKAKKLAKGTEKIESAVLKSIKGPKGETIQPQSLSQAMIKTLSDQACIEGSSGQVDGPELVVIYPKDNVKELKQIDQTPKMPDLTIKARLLNYNKDVFFYVTFTKLQWIAPGTSPQKKTTGYFEGKNTGNGEVEIPFTLPDGYIRGGDDMTIDVRAVAGGQTYVKTIDNPFIIKGLNPSPQTLYAALGEDIYAAVAWKESSFRQFDGDPGFPLQGEDGNDIGVMGLRGPNLNDDRIWNWLSNVRFGVNYFNSCMAEAINYNTSEDFKDYKPAPPQLNNQINSTDKNQNQVFLQAYCYYNAGPKSGTDYWDWDPGDPDKGINGKWKEIPAGKVQARHNANALWTIFISKPWNN